MSNSNNDVYEGMTKPVGYRVDIGVLQEFVNHIEQNYNTTNHYVRKHLEQAMLNYIQESEQAKIRRMLEEALSMDVSTSGRSPGLTDSNETKKYHSLSSYFPDEAPTSSKLTKDALLEVYETEISQYPRPQINPDHINHSDIPQQAHHKQSVVAAIVRYQNEEIHRRDVLAAVSKFLGDSRHIISRHVPAVWESDFCERMEKNKFTDSDGQKHEFFISTENPELQLSDHEAVNRYIETCSSESTIRGQIRRAVERYGIHPDYITHKIADEYEVTQQ